LVERALQAEVTDHPGHGNNHVVTSEAGNIRNGRSKKILEVNSGERPVEILRNRANTFELQIITINSYSCKPRTSRI
jgi:putative transposase